MAFPGDHKTVQFPRGISSIVNAYLGPAGQVVMDTTLNTLSLQDGVTIGGIQIPNTALVQTWIAAVDNLPGDNALAIAGVDTEQRSWPSTVFGLFAEQNNAALTGIPTAPTAANGDNSTQIATSQWVKNWLASITGDNAGAIAGIDSTPKLWPGTAFAAFALLASPVFTGTPNAPTPGGASNSDRIATTSYVTANFKAIGYLGSNTAQVTFPIGHIVLADRNGYTCNRNGLPSAALRLSADNIHYQLGGSDPTLDGVWRSRGSDAAGNNVQMERTA